MKDIQKCFKFTNDLIVNFYCKYYESLYHP